MQWKGLYKVIAKVGEKDYWVMVGKKLKTFHANKSLNSIAGERRVSKLMLKNLKMCMW